MLRLYPPLYLWQLWWMCWKCQQLCLGECATFDASLIASFGLASQVTECQVACQSDGTERDEILVQERILVGDDSDRCSLSPNAGPCRGSLPRIYFDPQDGQCKKFLYGGKSSSRIKKSICNSIFQDVLVTITTFLASKSVSKLVPVMMTLTTTSWKNKRTYA